MDKKSNENSYATKIEDLPDSKNVDVDYNNIPLEPVYGGGMSNGSGNNKVNGVLNGNGLSNAGDEKSNKFLEDIDNDVNLKILKKDNGNMWYDKLKNKFTLKSDKEKLFVEFMFLVIILYLKNIPSFLLFISKIVKFIIPSMHHNIVFINLLASIILALVFILIKNYDFV
jgi:hypothetical protein